MSDSNNLYTEYLPVEGGNDAQPPLRQPEEIIFEGKKYNLVLKWERVGTEYPISRGPEYKLEGDLTNDVYCPDAAFLYTKSQTVPLLMHRLK